MCEGGDEMDQNFDATLAKHREGDEEEKKQVIFFLWFQSCGLDWVQLFIYRKVREFIY